MSQHGEEGVRQVKCQSEYGGECSRRGENVGQVAQGQEGDTTEAAEIIMSGDSAE